MVTSTYEWQTPYSWSIMFSFFLRHIRLIFAKLFKNDFKTSKMHFHNVLLYPLGKCAINQLRKYATHLFTTPLSNVIFDNMMSRLILTLTKQFFDNQFTHFKIKTWKVLYTMQVVKGTIFCCVRSSRRKCYNICYFS